MSRCKTCGPAYDAAAAAYAAYVAADAAKVAVTVAHDRGEHEEASR